MKLLDTNTASALLGGEVGYNELRKRSFHFAGKRLLKRIAGELGLGKGQYDLRSNYGGIAVSGEITLHSDTLYVQVSQWTFSGGSTRILYRRCDGRKDYVGETNHWFDMEQLVDAGNAEKFVHCLKLVGGLVLTSEVRLAA